MREGCRGIQITIGQPEDFPRHAKFFLYNYFIYLKKLRVFFLKGQVDDSLCRPMPAICPCMQNTYKTRQWDIQVLGRNGLFVLFKLALYGSTVLGTWRKNTHRNNKVISGIL